MCTFQLACKGSCRLFRNCGGTRRFMGVMARSKKQRKRTGQASRRARGVRELSGLRRRSRSKERRKVSVPIDAGKEFDAPFESSSCSLARTQRSAAYVASSEQWSWAGSGCQPL